MLEQNIASRQFLGGFAGAQNLAARVDDDDGLGGLIQDRARKLAFLDHGFVVALLGQIGNHGANGLNAAGFQPI